MAVDVAARKAEIRSRVRAARAARSADERARVANALADVLLGVPEVATAAVVAAYVGVRGEPETLVVMAALRSRGIEVLLPVVTEDGIDWGGYDGAARLVDGPHGLRQPAGPLLGVDAIGRADVIVVPALAVDDAGHRLGQGGGYYDRALLLARPEQLTIAVVHDDEVLAVVPAADDDVPISAYATPTRLHRIGK